MGQLFSPEGQPRSISPKHVEVFLDHDGFIKSLDGDANVAELISGAYFHYGPDSSGDSPDTWEFLTEHEGVTSSTKQAGGDAFAVGTKFVNLATGEVWVRERDGTDKVWTLKADWGAGIGLETSDINTLAKINAIITDATLIDTDDARLSDDRDPNAHTHEASEISDASTEGKAILTAASYSVIRGLLDLEAGTDFYSVSAADAAFAAISHTHPVSELSDASSDSKAILTAANNAAIRGLLDLEAGTDFYSVSAADAAFAAISHTHPVSELSDASSDSKAILTAANNAAIRGLLDLEAGTDFYSKSAADAAFATAAQGAIADTAVQPADLVGLGSDGAMLHAVTDGGLETAISTDGDYLTVAAANWTALKALGVTAQSSGRGIYFPSGNFPLAGFTNTSETIDDVVSITSQILVCGAGLGVTTIEAATPSEHAVLFKIASPGATFRFKDITLDINQDPLPVMDTSQSIVPLSVIFTGEDMTVGSDPEGTITMTAHDFDDQDEVRLFTTGDLTGSGYAVATTYKVIKIDANRVQLSTDGVTPIEILAAPIGNHTIAHSPATLDPFVSGDTITDGYDRYHMNESGADVYYWNGSTSAWSLYRGTKLLCQSDYTDTTDYTADPKVIPSTKIEVGNFDFKGFGVLNSGSSKDSEEIYVHHGSASDLAATALSVYMDDGTEDSNLRRKHLMVDGIDFRDNRFSHHCYIHPQVITSFMNCRFEGATNAGVQFQSSSGMNTGGMQSFVNCYFRNNTNGIIGPEADSYRVSFAPADVDDTDDTINIASHPFASLERVTVSATGLDADTVYRVIVVDADNIKISIDGASGEDLTATAGGSGTFYVIAYGARPRLQVSNCTFQGQGGVTLRGSASISHSRFYCERPSMISTSGINADADITLESNLFEYWLPTSGASNPMLSLYSDYAGTFTLRNNMFRPKRGLATNTNVIWLTAGNYTTASGSKMRWIFDGNDFECSGIFNNGQGVACYSGYYEFLRNNFAGGLGSGYGWVAVAATGSGGSATAGTLKLDGNAFDGSTGTAAANRTAIVTQDGWEIVGKDNKFSGGAQIKNTGGNTLGLGIGRGNGGQIATASAVYLDPSYDEFQLTGSTTITSLAWGVATARVSGSSDTEPVLTMTAPVTTMSGVFSGDVTLRASDGAQITVDGDDYWIDPARPMRLKSIPTGWKVEKSPQFFLASERSSNTPDYQGQLAVETDTGLVYAATGITAGDWEVPSNAPSTVYVVSDSSRTNLTGDGTSAYPFNCTGIDSLKTIIDSDTYVPDGSTLVIGPGIFELSGAIQSGTTRLGVNIKKNLKIQGAGRRSTVIKISDCQTQSTDGTTKVALSVIGAGFESPYSQPYSVEIKDCLIDANMRNFWKVQKFTAATRAATVPDYWGGAQTTTDATSLGSTATPLFRGQKCVQLDDGSVHHGEETTNVAAPNYRGLGAFSAGDWAEQEVTNEKRFTTSDKSTTKPEFPGQLGIDIETGIQYQADSWTAGDWSPLHVAQYAIQTDTEDVYVSTGVTAGDWSLDATATAALETWTTAEGPTSPVPAAKTLGLNTDTSLIYISDGTSWTQLLQTASVIKQGALRLHCSNVNIENCDIISCGHFQSTDEGFHVYFAPQDAANTATPALARYSGIHYHSEAVNFGFIMGTATNGNATALFMGFLGRNRGEMLNCLVHRASRGVALGFADCEGIVIDKCRVTREVMVRTTPVLHDTNTITTAMITHCDFEVGRLEYGLTATAPHTYFQVSNCIYRFNHLSGQASAVVSSSGSGGMLHFSGNAILGTASNRPLIGTDAPAWVCDNYIETSSGVSYLGSSPVKGKNNRLSDGSFMGDEAHCDFTIGVTATPTTGDYRGAWTTLTTYYEDDLVAHGGSLYIETTNPSHYSGGSTEPGVGASWDTYWDLTSWEDEASVEIEAEYTIIDTCATNGTVLLPRTRTGVIARIQNNGASTLTIAPREDSTIDGAAECVPTTLATSTTGVYIATSTTTWITFE